jgi:hypothetical protein
VSGRALRHPARLLGARVWLLTGCASAYRSDATIVRESLDDEARWYQEVQDARLAPHLYLGPAWFVRDPAGWSPLGWYPYSSPGP